MSSNPIIPSPSDAPFDVDNDEEVPTEFGMDGVDHMKADGDGDEVQEVSPSLVNAKRRARVVLEKPPKKQKSGTTLVIQEQVTKIAIVKVLLWFDLLS